MQPQQAQSVEVPYFDTHKHGRRGALKRLVLPEAAKRSSGAALEPNTMPHLRTYDDVCSYLDEANKISPNRHWLGSIYLTSEPNIPDVERLWREGRIAHIKHYPPHGSTHTAESVSTTMLLDKNSGPGKLLCFAQECGLPLKRHAEIAHDDHGAVDPYEREKRDLHEAEPRLMEVYPRLRRILAHVSTAEAAKHMADYGDPDRYICELTAHHLILDRRAMYDGGAILPDHHCLPVVKHRRHLIALRKMLAKKPPYVVAGSDAAAHGTKNKYRFDAFGGYYTYHCDLELYIQTLDELGILDYADSFLFGNAKRFFGDLLPDGSQKFRLERHEWTVLQREPIPGDDDSVTPFGFNPDESKRFRFQWQLAA